MIEEALIAAAQQTNKALHRLSQLERSVSIVLAIVSPRRLLEHFRFEVPSLVLGELVVSREVARVCRNLVFWPLRPIGVVVVLYGTSTSLPKYQPT